jgi:hypothetical protein
LGGATDKSRFDKRKIKGSKWHFSIYRQIVPAPLAGLALSPVWGAESQI